MYSQIFLVTSVRGSGVAPITAARVADGVIGFMNAALGVRGAAFFAAGFLTAGLAAAFLAGAAFFAAGLAAAFFATGLAAAFLAGAAFLAAGLAAAFFAAGFLAAGLAADFLAVAIFKPPSQMCEKLRHITHR